MITVRCVVENTATRGSAFWAEHGIAHSDETNVNNAVAFGEICRALLSILAQEESGRRPIVAHFHEWMSGVTIPMLRREGWPGTTVLRPTPPAWAGIWR